MRYLTTVEQVKQNVETCLRAFVACGAAVQSFLNDNTQDVTWGRQASPLVVIVICLNEHTG